MRESYRAYQVDILKKGEYNVRGKNQPAKERAETKIQRTKWSNCHGTFSFIF